LNAQTEDQALHNNAALASSHQNPPPQSSTLRNIFIGKDGLRAGWSLLIVEAGKAAGESVEEIAAGEVLLE
jgi:hypothetical protein